MASPEKETICGSSSSTATTAEAKESICKVVDPLVLLEEYWFYRSSLTSNTPSASPLSSPLIRYWDDVSSTARLMAADPPMKTPPMRNTSTRSRVRTPSISMAPPLAGGPDSDDPNPTSEEAYIIAMGRRPDFGDPNPTSEEAYMIAMGRRSLTSGDCKIASSSLLKAPSLPAPSEFSISKLQHSSSYLDYHGHHSSTYRIKRHNSSAPRIQQPQRDFAKGEGSIKWPCGRSSITMNEANYRKLFFQEKKWKSFSNLESMEVQGFKDLGFVFDQEEVNDRLANVIPGLREKRTSSDGDAGDVNREPQEISRPYLSEAWLMQQRSAPPLVLRRVSRSSPADVKEQLRFWARAVACNVRQEC